MTTLVLEDAATSVTTRGVEILQARPALFTEDLSDEELISAICSRAEWAIELLYQRYQRYAYSLAYRIVHDGSAAEDVVQEVFLSIWHKASYYQRERGGVQRWLQTIVHHRAIDWVRAATHRDYQWRPLQIEDEQEPASEQADLWEEVWHGEQQAMICAALGQLPTEQREVIKLAYFGGYTYAEIAERGGIPLGTVKGRMRLGLQKMRHILQE